MVRQDGTAGIVGLRYANPTYPNFPPHPLPSPTVGRGFYKAIFVSMTTGGTAAGMTHPKWC